MTWVVVLFQVLLALVLVALLGWQVYKFIAMLIDRKKAKSSSDSSDIQESEDNSSSVNK